MTCNTMCLREKAQEKKNCVHWVKMHALNQELEDWHKTKTDETRMSYHRMIVRN